MKTGTLIVLLAATTMFCSGMWGQSTSGSLALTDDSFTHPGAPMVGSAGGPRRYRAIEFNVVTTGSYTFTYSPSGYTGALYLYQGVYLPSNPIVNIWDWGNTGSPVVVAHNLSVTGKFVVVLTSTTNNATGTWTLGITGPGTLEMAPVVNSCSPTSGSTGGGTNVTLSGNFFTSVNSVTFGGSSATNLTVVNDTTITCTTPAHAAGAVTVRASKPSTFGLAGERFSAYTYNLTPTSVSSINRQNPSGATTNASSVVFRVTFAASVGGVNTGNFSITKTGGIAGEGVSSVSGSGTVWDVTVNTGTGDGTIRLDMVNNTSMTPTLTNLPFTSGQVYTIDKTAPTVSSINRAGADPTNAASVSFTVTFSESVTGVTTGAFSLDTTGVSGASITGISGTGTTRSVTVNTGTGDGTVSIDLLTVTGILDTAGNALGSAFVAGQAYTIDKSPPGISIGAPSVSSTISGPVDFTITYTGASAVTLATGNITLNTTGTATGSVSVAGTGTASRTVTISSISGTGTIGISIASGTASDAAGNSAPAAGPSATFTVTAIPAVTSIVRVGSDPTNAAQVDWTVTFGSAVTGVAASNFSLNVTGVTGASISNVAGSGTTWTVTASTGSGNGTIRLDMDNATGVSPGVSNVPFTSGQTYNIDKTAPTVTAIVRAAANPTNASSVTFTVTFSETVTGVTTGAFALDVSGVTGASITGVSGTGNTRTVTVGTGTGNGSVSIDLATVAGIVDGAGNVLAGAFTSGEAYTVDKTAPSVSSITRVGTNPTNAASVDFTVTFNESVTGVTVGAFAMAATGVTGSSITGISGTGATRTVTVNTGSGDGTVGIELASVAGIIDAAGNTLSGTFTAGEAYAVDKSAPSVSSIVRAGSDPTSAASVDFTVTFSESVTGVTTGAFSLDVTGVTGSSITGISGSGTTRTISVNTGSGDGTVSIDLTTTTGIVDAVGNTLSGAFTAGEAYTIDKSAPGISIGAPSATSTASGPIDFTITYVGATAVTLAVGDITLHTTGTAAGSVGVTGTGTSTRTVTISGISGNGTLGISIAAGTATDGAGNPAGAAGPSTTFDVANVPGISIGSPSVSLTRGGPVDFVITYTNATAVTLASGDVTLNTTGTASGTVDVTGTGTATRTVTISAVTGDGTFSISIAAATASNPGGNALAAGPSASVDVDNTVPQMTPGAAVTLSQGATESAAIVGSVTDSLSAAGSLVVTATSVPTGLSVLNIVNTTGVITADISAAAAMTTGSYQIEFTVTDVAGNSSTANLNVNVLANALPTITAILDQSILMNGNTGALAFDVDDADEGPNALVVTVTANNQVLVDLLTDIALGGAGMARTLTITPQANHTGVSVITVTVEDSVGAQASVSFTLTVTDTVDAPALGGLIDIEIQRDETSQAFTFTATDPQGDGTLTAPQAFSADQSLILDGSIVITGTAPNFSFTLTPEAGQVGTVELTFFVTDGTHTTSRNITVTVVEPPSSSGGDDDDDEDCSTGSGTKHWPAFLAALALTLLAVRQRRARA